MYTYYHEHFEMCNFDYAVRVTCVCGNNFIWSVEPNGSNFVYRCPHCEEPWILGCVGNIITLTREKTGAKIELYVENKDCLKPILSN